MSRRWMVIHSLILLAWLGLVVHLAVDTALLGNEETHLRMAMGEDRAERKELEHRHERLRADLDRETRPALLQAAGKRLGLTLEPRSGSLASNARGLGGGD